MVVGPAAEGIEGIGPAALAVAQVAVAGIADDIPPPVTAVVKGTPRRVVTEGKSQLADRPVVVGILHRIRETAFIARHIVVLHVGLQIAVAGKALEDLAGGRRLHLDGRLEGLAPVEVADAICQAETICGISCSATITGT